MVRAGVVAHPAPWRYGGYKEIQEPRKKNVLIDYERLKEFFGTNSHEQLKNSQRRWVSEYLEETEKIREEECTRSIAEGVFRPVFGSRPPDFPFPRRRVTSNPSTPLSLQKTPRFLCLEPILFS
jgi:hypothetical protein